MRELKKGKNFSKFIGKGFHQKMTLGSQSKISTSVINFYFPMRKDQEKLEKTLVL